MKRLLFLLAVVLIASVQAIGQKKMITGKVIDEQGSPLPGVSIFNTNSQKATITNIDGAFSIDAEEGNVIRFSFVGYETQEVAISNQTEINITLLQKTQEIEQVVVTALGIKREKKALGYAVQDIKSESLTSTGNANIASALQGKVAGVVISQSGSGVGGSSRIEIRGASSLTDNNSPLIVVDGVPFNSSSSFIDRGTNKSDDQAGIWGGRETSGGIADINPEDIESVSVLKGPNAAALYGSRAGNGVIVITTKKGANKDLNINYNSNVTISQMAYTLDLQHKYGQGNEGVYDRFGTESWGPKMEGQMLQSWTGDMVAYTSQNNRLEDFTRNGISQSHNISLSTGSDKGTLRVSASRDKESGIYNKHNINKSNFDLKATYDVAKWLNIDSKVSYILTRGEQRPEMGYYSYVSYFNNIPMNIRTQDLKPGFTINQNGQHVEKLYTTANANYRNPYFIQSQVYNKDERYRGFGYLASTISFLPELKLKLKYGIDFYHENAKDGNYYADNVNSNKPDYNTNERFFKEENYEFLLSYNKNFNDFSVSVNAGGNKMYTYSQKLASKSGHLPSEGYYFLGYGTNITSTEDFREQEVQSLYGFAQLGYKNMVYLDVTARNDWSSTLPKDNNSYFYPSFSLSGIISEMVKLPDWFTFAKVRGSWAQVGKATEPYMTDMNYTISTWNFNYLNAGVPETLVNKNLKPEISSSVEFGTELRFLSNRIGLDFTYYSEKTENQILKIGMDQSTGYKNKLINAGLITNKGVEVLLNTTPVKKKDFALDLNFNFAKNTTMVDELDKDLKEYSFGGLNNGVEVIAIEGEKMGDIKGFKYSRDESGKVIVDDNGLPMRKSKAEVIGNIQPDWTGSVSLRAEYKGLFVSSLVSVQKGGKIFSASEQSSISSGTALRTAENNRMAFFYDGVTQTGDVNNKLITAQQYWNRIATIDEEFIYDASYVKLSEVAMGYSLPQTILNKIPYQPIKSARISLIGRNLFYFMKHTPGTVPDASSYSNAYAAQAFDFSPVPTSRIFGFSVNLGF